MLYMLVLLVQDVTLEVEDDQCTNLYFLTTVFGNQTISPDFTSFFCENLITIKVYDLVLFLMSYLDTKRDNNEEIFMQSHCECSWYV